MMKKPQAMLIPVAAIQLLCCSALLAFNGPVIAGIALSLCILVTALCWFELARRHNAQQAMMDDILLVNSSAAGKLISQVGVPCMVFDEQGRIIWRNPAMRAVYEGPDIKRLPASCNPRFPTQSAIMEHGASSYQVVSLPVERGKEANRLVFQYWLNRTETEHYKRLFEEQMPRVALIYVDNFEELAADVQFHRNSVLTEVERLISQMVSEVEGIYRRYDNGRFLLVFEARWLPELEKSRFALLEQAHSINTGTEQPVTLSIAVGAAERIGASDEAARQAMELALGRGGDQAVVKAGVNYAFYGGRRQVESRQSRVRARLFAKALFQLMESATDIYIMGHKQPDMDCLGAALGILRCARQAGSRAFIVLDQPNSTIQQAVDSMRQNRAYDGVLITPDVVRTQIRASSVLVVVDTQRAQSTIAPDLIERATKLVLIDHHRRSADYIDNATLNYLEARASSTSEMVTETLQYFDEAIRPTAFECGAMLAGITLDTKHFAFNVGARTFEAAAYLRKNGADLGAVKMMFRDDRQTYANRVDVVKAAVMYQNIIAISSCAREMENALLIAAQAADELIGIRGVEAAFVLCYEGDIINVSGRSLGSISAQLVLEKLGGGGHLTMAGAQLQGATMDEALARLKEAITTYFKDNPPA